MSTVGSNHSEPWIWWLTSLTASGKSMNGVPAPLAEDEDSDFGREPRYDPKDDKKRRTRGRRRSGKREEPGKLGVRSPTDGDEERIANFNLLDHGFAPDESDKESLFDHDYSKPR